MREIRFVRNTCTALVVGTVHVELFEGNKSLMTSAFVLCCVALIDLSDLEVQESTSGEGDENKPCVRRVLFGKYSRWETPLVTTNGVMC